MLRTDLIRMGRLAKEIAQTKQDMKDLSDKRGSYANVATYRLYKFHKDAQVYGDEFLAVEYIDITDAHEIEILKTVPNQAKLAEIVQAHGIAVNNGDKWYPVNMFEAYNSSFNVKARQSVGFSGGAKALQIGNIIYTKLQESQRMEELILIGLRLQTEVMACIMDMRKIIANYFLLQTRVLVIQWLTTLT